MSSRLVLSLFPGLDMLGMAFEEEGFCVVAGPDVCWGRDVRAFHPPAGVFEGIVGGPPCQTFSSLANLVRAKGLEPRFGNLIPEFVRCVEEAAPAWFLMENTPLVPEECWPAPKGYSVTCFVYDHSWIDSGDGLGMEQMRKRRFWFELPKAKSVVAGGANTLGPGGTRWEKVKKTDVCAGHDGRIASGSVVEAARKKRQSVTGRHSSDGMGPAHPGNPPRYSLPEMLELQGLPPDMLDEAPFTMQGKRKLVGNGVPIAMGRALARAALAALGGDDGERGE